MNVSDGDEFQAQEDLTTLLIVEDPNYVPPEYDPTPGPGG